MEIFEILCRLLVDLFCIHHDYGQFFVYDISSTIWDFLQYFYDNKFLSIHWQQVSLHHTYFTLFLLLWNNWRLFVRIILHRNCASCFLASLLAINEAKIYILKWFSKKKTSFAGISLIHNLCWKEILLLTNLLAGSMKTFGST